MFNIKNKKGLSEIIAIVIFIVLTMISVSLVFASVKTLLEKPEVQISPFVSCTQILQIPPKIGNVIYNEETGDVEVTVKRHSADDYTNSFDFVLKTPIESNKYACGPSCGGVCNIQNPGESKIFYFAVNKENIPEEIT